MSFDAAPLRLGLCGIGGLSGRFPRNLSSLLLNASVLQFVVKIWKMIQSVFWTKQFFLIDFDAF